jgi:hypothetical protein
MLRALSQSPSQVLGHDRLIETDEFIRACQSLAARRYPRMTSNTTLPRA